MIPGDEAENESRRPSDYILDRRRRRVAAAARGDRAGSDGHHAKHVHVFGDWRECGGGGAVCDGAFSQAAAVLFLAGFLDMADGQVARRAGRVTAFGAFLDSTLDRYSDLALYMGLVVYYTLVGAPFYMGLAAVAMASSFMVSYARARAESLIPSCKVGFLERPERLVLLILGGAFRRMAPVLWVIATFSTLTVIHRVVYTWQEIARRAAHSGARAVPQPF